MSTYAGVTREVPILPFATNSGAVITRGAVVQFNPPTQTVVPWLAGTTQAFGIATSDSDPDLQQVDVLVGKGCSAAVRCAAGIVPEPGDPLFWGGAGGSVTNVPTGTPFARAIGFGINEFVEAVIL